MPKTSTVKTLAMAIDILGYREDFATLNKMINDAIVKGDNSRETLAILVTTEKYREKLDNWSELKNSYLSNFVDRIGVAMTGKENTDEHD